MLLVVIIEDHNHSVTKKVRTDFQYMKDKFSRGGFVTLFLLLGALALLVPFFIGQYIDGELLTGWTFTGNWSCRLCD